MAKKKTVAKNAAKKKATKRLSEVMKPSGMTLEEWQVALRQQAAMSENFGIEPIDEELSPGEYWVRNPRTHWRYKVVYRGADSVWNYCSCLDFKTSQLGTCKHLEAVKNKISNSRKMRVHRDIPAYTSIYLSYRKGRTVRIRIGSECESEFKELASRYFDADGALLANGYEHFPTLLNEARLISDTFRCYDDALEFVLEVRESKTRTEIVNGLTDEVLDSLLSVSLFPYQKEGVRFAVRQGRTLIADEMGLGKTIQAIATTEVLRKHNLLGNVLVVCPTSLKYQWKSEIERFTKADVMVVEGDAAKRKALYANAATYKIVSYHTMANDAKFMGHIDADMVILDEVQRLKNWHTRIASAARRLKSKYMVALSGTPLENKLEELFSVMELVDQYCLGPYYQFRDQCIVTNDTGKVLGYRNLNTIGTQVKQKLIRRRKRDVEMQLPHRRDTNLLVPMTDQQMAIHEECASTVAQLIHKWNAHHFLSEKDRHRLLLNLNMMRMVCDSTFILDQHTRYDVKIGECLNIIDQMIQGGDEKVVVFSQWERMTRLLVQELEKRGIGHVYLHGGVPSPKRGAIVQSFQSDPDCRVFLSTDAGSTGLNLQSASLIVNLDLPWNPAVLEQRIGRIYRLGQQRNIQVINLVSKGTIEENMIGKLRFKQNMFEGVLDNGDDSIFISDDKFSTIANVVGSVIEEDADKEPATAVSSDDLEDNRDAIDTHDTPEASSPDSLEYEFEFEEHESEAQAEQSVKPDDEHHKTTPSTADDTPEQLVEKGISFLSGLAKTLQSPEATARLVDSIVKTDEATGQTSINIPVADKDSVTQLVSLVSKLFSSLSK